MYWFSYRVRRSTSWKFCQKMSRDPLYYRQLTCDVLTELPSVKVFINICIHHSAAFYTFNFFRKDVRLPVQLQRAMAAEAEAAREARAKVNSRHHIILTSCHHVIMSSCHHVIMSSCHHAMPGDSCGGRAEGQPGAAGGLQHHRREFLRAAAQISAGPQIFLCGCMI